MQKIFANINSHFIVVICALIGVGLVNLYSAVYFWGEGGSLALFWSQLIWMMIGLVLMFFVSFIDYRFFSRAAVPVYVISIGLLVLSLVMGSEIRGTQGWLKLGFLTLQPAEFAKVAYIIILARYFANNPSYDGYGFWELWRPLLLMLIPCGLIVLQGDLGSSMFLVLIFATVSFFARIRRRTLIAFIVIGVAAMMAIYT